MDLAIALHLASTALPVLQEEEEREKEAKKVEIARYEREMELAARMEAAEKERKKLAMQKASS